MIKCTTCNLSCGWTHNLINFNIIIDNIDESGENISCMIRNPNMQGSIKYYDEGNWGIYAYSDYDEDYQWVGIKFSEKS